MEPSDGITLQDLLVESAPLSRERSLRILSEVASALDHAHSSGVAHGDIRPANIVVRADRTATVTGFGITNLTGARMAPESGRVTGSSPYLAPEQIKGDPVSARSDQFSLGGVAYTLLTGRRPFDADTAASLIQRVLTEDPIPVQILTPGLGSGVDRVLRRAMAKNPAHRFASCSEFVIALGSAWAEAPLPDREMVPSPKRAHRRPGFIWSRLRSLLSSRIRPQ